VLAVCFLLCVVVSSSQAGWWSGLPGRLVGHSKAALTVVSEGLGGFNPRSAC